MGLAIFFFTIFSILGVAIWSGKIHYRCYKTPLPFRIEGTEYGDWELNNDYVHLCNIHDPSSCPSESFCGSRLE